MISVIVPYKNSAKWIRRCLESLRIQKGDFEFLIVNDNSIDDGPEIAKRFTKGDSRFRLFDNECGPGVSGARNTGLDHAVGEWITFLDADDEMLENAETAFNLALMIDANIHQFNHLRYYKKADAIKIKYENEGGFYDIKNLPDAWFGVWNKLFRASFVKNIRFEEGLQYGEDGLFVLECLAKDNKIHHADIKLYTVKHRLENMASLSHRKNDMDVIKQIRAYEEFYLRQEDKNFKRMLCLEFAKLWERIAGLI